MFTRVTDYICRGALIAGSLLLFSGALNATTITICKKSSDPTAPVSGTFNFTVDGTTVVSVLADGTCDSRIYTEGNHTIVEGIVLGTELTSITVTPPERQVSQNLATRTVVVEALPVETPTVVTFFNKPSAGNQGCTPGYWKNHTSAWPSSLHPTDLVSSVFTGFVPAIEGETLLAALQGGGGSGLSGAETILVRAAVAALLNASSGVVKYPSTTAQITSAVNTAVATGDRDKILAVATSLDNANNGVGGCPLN